MNKTLRLSIFSLSTLALVSAIWGGLYRIGWHVNPLAGELPGIHGPLVVCGFLGAVFALDRALVLKKLWGDVVPVFILVGSFLLFVRPVSQLCPAIIFVGSLGFTAMCFEVNLRQPNLYNRMIFLGSLLWLAGIGMWFLRWPVYNVYLWWLGFVLFTMVGQRLELARRVRLTQPPPQLLATAICIVFLGQIALAVGHLRGSDALMDIVLDSIFDPRTTWGMRIAGTGIATTAAWLLVYDAAWSLLKSKGNARFSAVCLISSYGWLAVSGVISVLHAGIVSGPPYDALIHSFFIGFVWFIIFGHGPILAFSSMKMRAPPMASLYLPVAVLHVSLVMRVAGDMSRNAGLVKNGGLLNAIGLLLFILLLSFRVVRERATVSA